MDALEAILTRRSTRRFSEEAVDKILIEKVIEAGRYAPSGSNSQSTHFIVFTDPAQLEEIAGIVQDAFAAMELEEDMYISMKASISAAKKGGYVFHYKTPVLIVTANKKGYGNAMADSACALENMMIAANALGLGSCWINQLHWLEEKDAVHSFLMRHGLQEDETVTGALALGHPAQALTRRMAPRKGNPVTWA